MSAQELITEHLDLWAEAVTKKSTSGRGSNGKIELTGIKKLRELILELAFQGKLTKQISTDEPAQDYLDRAKTELEESGKELAKWKRSVVLPVDSKPFAIPKGWSWERFGHVGLVASSRRVLQGDWQDHGVPFYRAREIVKLSQQGFVDNELFISEHLFSELAENGHIPEENDLMLTGVGTIGVPYIVRQDDKFYFKDASVLVFKNFFGLNPQFLYYFCNTPFWKKSIHEGSMGTTVHTLTIARANQILIPIPPVEEQHRIVQKVDELMALCDQLEQQTSDQLTAHETLVDTLLGTLTQSGNATELAENWARLSAHFDTLFTTEQSIDKLKQTILQLAVVGRLVEQDAGDGPIVQLLERVSHEKQNLVRSKVLKRAKSLASLDTSALSSIPERWSWVNLGDIISVMDAGWSPACPPRPAALGKWGVLKTTAVQVMKYQGFENKQLPDNKEPKEQYEVRSGDILITRAGPKNRVGISCVVKETRDKLMISDKIIRFHLVEAGLSEEYICLCLNAGETYRYLEKAKSGMAESQMNISQDKLKAAPIPLCPIDEQHLIVQKVDELMALCDQLKVRLNQASETRCQLAEAVVSQAVN